MHEFHKDKLYYPSNKFLLNSEEEKLFFKTKWTTNVNRDFVRRIYDSINIPNQCPCYLLLAFNVCKAKAFELDDNNYVYNVHFSNEFELKNNFFSKANKEEVCLENLKFVKTNLPEIYNRCVFETDSQRVKNVKINTKCPQNKKYKIMPKNNVNIEIEENSQRLLEIVKKLQSEETTIEQTDLYEEGLKLYKILEYYNRFKVRLVDENLYIPKIPNNVKFKTESKRAQQKMFEKAIKFWGVEEIAMHSTKNIHCIQGQILPPGDNPQSMHNCNTRMCTHKNGFHSYYIQIRMADEVMTSVKICKDCKRRIK